MGTLGKMGKKGKFQYTTCRLEPGDHIAMIMKSKQAIPPVNDTIFVICLGFAGKKNPGLVVYPLVDDAFSLGNILFEFQNIQKND